jgi:hypothetical protein
VVFKGDEKVLNTAFDGRTAERAAIRNKTGDVYFQTRINRKEVDMFQLFFFSSLLSPPSTCNTVTI